MLELKKEKKFVPVNRGRIQRKTWCMGPYAGVAYNRTLCPLQSRLEHIYHGQSYARVDLNPMPESILDCQSGTLDFISVLCRLQEPKKSRTRTHKITNFNLPNGKQNVIINCWAGSPSIFLIKIFFCCLPASGYHGLPLLFAH